METIFTTQGFVQLISWLVIIAQVVYLVAAFLITREVALMNRSFKTQLAPLFTGAAYLHLLASAAILVYSLLVVL